MTAAQMESSRKWTPGVENAFLEACKACMTYSACRVLERLVRTGTGTEEKGRTAACCPSVNHEYGSENHGGNHAKCGDGQDHDHGPNFPPYKFQKDKSDSIGMQLDVTMQHDQLRLIMGAVAERCATVYDNVIRKGKEDGLCLPTSDEDKDLRDQILKEALTRELQKVVQDKRRTVKCMDSLEGGLLANPSGYTGGHLDYLKATVIRDLMITGVAVQNGFIGKETSKKVYDEVELLDFDGRFDEITQTSQENRTDRICWVASSDLDRQRFQGLHHLFHCMSALPYELNKKASLCLQASWVFQLAIFSENQSFYKKHMDGGFDADTNNGRKITAIYYPNAMDWQRTDGGSLAVWPRIRRDIQMAKGAMEDASVPPSKILQPKGETLVLMRSREVPHEVYPTNRKRFAISLWMCGPVGPGDAD